MASRTTEQSWLRSSRPPVIDISEADNESLRDDDDGVNNDAHQQGDAPAAEASQAQEGQNPWAPNGWSHDLPPKVELAVDPQRQGAALQITQRLLEKTLTAITSLQQSVATLTATVQANPPMRPPVEPATELASDDTKNKQPQLRQPGVQPIPTLADLLTSHTATKKR